MDPPVSIPFQRESGSKGEFTTTGISDGPYSFNSLPTGTRIQRRYASFVAICYQNPFQFPSNGKADPKSKMWSMSRLIWRFQFPSNGKADPKGHTICFGTAEKTMCFNSLPTGKRIQSYERTRRECGRWNWFQFPSNGKADPKRYAAMCDTRCVSFNSLPTGTRIQSIRSPSRLCLAPDSFNSLPTGTRIQSHKELAQIERRMLQFQFPSNGNAYPKNTMLNLHPIASERFNSLPTGTRIQS